MLARFSILVTAAIGFAALAGCGGGGSTTPPHHVPTAAPQTIYVASSTNNILEFPVTANGNTPPNVVIGGSNTTLVNPVPVAIDGTGAVYTSDFSSPAVLEFAAGASGNVAPSASLNGVNTELSEYCFGIAFDSQNRVYVTSQTDSTVAVFTAAQAGPNGNPAPIQFLSGVATTLGRPTGIAVDSSDNMYVTQAQSGTILKFAAGAGAGGNNNVAPAATIVTPGVNLSGIAINSAGQIFVDDASLNAIYVFSAGATPTLLGTISGSATLLNYPIGIAVDRNSNIYIANHQGFLSNEGAITVYAANAYTVGNVAPTATITYFTGSPYTNNLINPYGIAVH